MGNGEGSEIEGAGGIKSVLDRLSRRGPWDRPWDRMVMAWPAARPWGVGSGIWTSSGSLRMINLNSSERFLLPHRPRTHTLLSIAGPGACLCLCCNEAPLTTRLPLLAWTQQPAPTILGRASSSPLFLLPPLLFASVV